MMTTLFGRLSRLAVALIPALCLVMTSARGDNTGSLSQIRSRMQTYVDQGEIAGAVTVVGRHDGILSVDVVGQQDIEHHRPMTKDTIFRIASMTKPVTAIGIMMLVDEGKLAVEDPVEKHLPEFRGQMLVVGRTKDSRTVMLDKPARPITIRDLMTHTSGLPGWPAGLGDLYTKRNRSLAEATLAISQRPLDFEPGTKWAYCNTGIDTLGRIIEVASGQSYEQFLQTRLFDPLDMKDTTFYPTPAQRDRVAITYDRKDGQLVPTVNTLVDLPATGGRFPIPAGGLYSTGTDLAKLYQMLLSHGMRGDRRFLSEKSIADMTKIHTGDLKTGFSEGMGFGLGWGVIREPKGVTEALSPGTYGHAGAFGTQGWLDPAKDLFTVLLIQRNSFTSNAAIAMRRDLQGLAAAAVRK
jgi:CubicO group peptidase (beta-lactamase class C family)